MVASSRVGLYWDDIVSCRKQQCFRGDDGGLQEKGPREGSKRRVEEKGAREG